MMSEGLLFTSLFSPIAAESITRRICKPLQIRRVIVVGYQGIKTGETDYSQIGGTFTTVSSNDNVFCLKDLTVTVLPALEPTYDSDRKRWKGGCRAPADFVLNIMDKNGHFEKTYYWQYYKTGASDAPTVIQGWFKDDGMGDYVQLTTDELDKIKVPAGKAFYISGGGNTLNIPAPEL